MFSAQLEALLARLERMQKLVWTALTLSIVIYGAVAFAAAGGRAQSALPAALRPLFYLAGAGAAAVSLALHRRRRAARPPGSTLPAPAPGAVLGGNPDLAARVSELSPEERGAFAAVVRGFAPWMVCLVLNEAVAIFGLVLAMLDGSPADVVPFGVAALLLNAAMRPDGRRLAAAALGQVAV